MEPIKTFQVGDLTVKIIPEDFPESPRDWDNAGTFATWHRHYNLGDIQPKQSPEEYIAELPEGSLILPVFLMDHSGLSLRTNSAMFRACDSAGWDWGQVGIIHISPENGIKEWGEDWREQAKKCLIGEIETMDQYLRGDVYGFVIERDDEHVDSCWGFYGVEYCEQEARSCAEIEIKHEQKLLAELPQLMAI